MRLFEQHPDTKAIFRKFQGIDLMALEQSIEIKEHGERVMKIVDEVVHVIENPNKVWDMLISLGKIHFGECSVYLISIYPGIRRGSFNAFSNSELSGFIHGRQFPYRLEKIPVKIFIAFGLCNSSFD